VRVHQPAAALVAAFVRGRNVGRGRAPLAGTTAPAPPPPLQCAPKVVVDMRGTHRLPRLVLTARVVQFRDPKAGMTRPERTEEWWVALGNRTL
jgi:hypothetical protein